MGRLFPTYLIAQPHHPTRRGHGDETAGNESLHTTLLCGLGEGNLILLLSGADAANDDINLCQQLDELLLGRLQVTLADLDAPFLEFNHGGLVYGSGADESVDFLEPEIESQRWVVFLLFGANFIVTERDRESVDECEYSVRKSKGTYKRAILDKTVGD